MVDLQKISKVGDKLYNFYDAENSVYIRKENEKKKIKRIGIAAGLSIIAYVAIQNIISFLVYFSPLGEIYDKDLSMQCVVSIFLSVLGIALPFGSAGYFLNKGKDTPVVDFRGPVSTPLMIAATGFGFFVCLAGNYVTSLFVSFMDELGILLSAPEYSPPTDFAGRIIYVVSIAVVPALVEEFAVRGVMLQSMRKYGDKFAIIASALIFAVMHGNLIQAPFALIAGVGIGYAVCITNSIRTGILIHFVNNLYSVIVEFLVADIQNEDTLNTVYLTVTVILYAVSILASVLFFIMKKQRKFVPSFTVINEKEKMKAFILTLPMIIALLIMISITSNYIELG